MTSSPNMFSVEKRPNSIDFFHLFHLEANMIPSAFSFLVNFDEIWPLWRGTSEKLETSANCATIF